MTRTILYLSDSRLPSEKANGYQVMKMCEALAGTGAQVELLYPYRAQPEELRGIHDIFAFYNVRRLFRLRQVRSADTVTPAAKISVPLLRNFVQFIHFVTYALAVTIITTKHWRDPSTILYGRSEYSFMLLTLLKRFIRPKLVFEAHVFPGKRGSSLRLDMIRRLDGLVVITEQLRQRYLEAGMPAERTLVAHDGVDLTQFAVAMRAAEARTGLGLPNDRPIIGYIGRFHTMGMEKGITTLITALAELRKRVSRNVMVLCVGGPLDVVAPYRKLMRNLGLPVEAVRFVDRQPVADVPRWIRACDVVTIPFPWNEHLAYYASPMKLFEYMASGVPIVASDLPSLKEILRDGINALLVPPGDAVKLAEGLYRILSDPPLAQKIGVQAQRDVASYAWEKRTRRILDFTDGLGKK